MLLIDDSDNDNNDTIHDACNKKNKEYNQRDSSGSNNKHYQSVSMVKKRVVIKGDSIVKNVNDCQLSKPLTQIRCLLNHSLVQQQSKYQPLSNLQLKKNLMVSF